MKALIPEALNGGHQGNVMLSISLFFPWYFSILITMLLDKLIWETAATILPLFLPMCIFSLLFFYFHSTSLYFSSKKSFFHFSGKTRIVSEWFIPNLEHSICDVPAICFLSGNMHVCILCDFMVNHFSLLLSIITSSSCCFLNRQSKIYLLIEDSFNVKCNNKNNNLIEIVYWAQILQKCLNLQTPISIF